MQKILIVEDDKKIRDELNEFLSRYGYECSLLTDFQNIVKECVKSDANLILLDVNLPYFDGYYVCREVRKVSNIPIIIVTSRQSEMDELMSMNLGADDYITKPYNTQILLARITSLMRRTYQNLQGDIIDFKGLKFNVANGTIKFNECEEELTKNENKILNYLLKNKEKIVSRNDLIEQLWQCDEFIDDNTLTVNVNRLRKKLETIGAKDFIKTKRGQGYILS